MLKIDLLEFRIKYFLNNILIEITIKIIRNKNLKIVGSE